MTILAGFRCLDGLLLAGDTLYSGAAQNTHGPKLWILHQDDPVVVFGGTGTVGVLTRARDEIARKLKPGMSLQWTLDTIDDALAKVNQKMPPHGDWPKLQAVAVIRSEGRNALYQNVVGEIALSPVDSPTTCLGVDALGNYFAESLFKSGMTIKWAKVVAAHLVWNCKTYASGYCGGDTHLIEVPNVGPAAATIDQAVIHEQESHLAILDDVIRLLLPDGRANDDTLEHRLSLLKDMVPALQRSFFLKAETGGFVSTLAPVTSNAKGRLGGAIQPTGELTLERIPRKGTESPT